MIEANNISKDFGRNRVLNKVDLSFEKGRLTSLIGPNGSGKSTLLAILARLLPSEEGDVLLDDRNLRSWPRRELALKIAFMRQAHDIGLRITVRELVSLGRYPHSQGRMTKEDDHRVMDAMLRMDIEELGERSLSTLSGGQRQRAYIAMTLAQDADYLFLDEPLNNLDLHHAVDIMGILSKLAKEKDKGVIVVMHDINLSALFADEILVLKDGSIRASGTPDDIMESALLSDVYAMPLAVEKWQGKKICLVDMDGLPNT